MKKAKFPSSILRKPVLAFLATNDEAGLAQAWNFRDVCSFYFILLAKESDLNKPQQWLLLCPQRSAPDKNIFLGAATSLHSTSQSRQSLPGLPDVLHGERTQIQRKSPQKATDREKTHISHACLLDLQFGGGCLFQSFCSNKAFGQEFCWYFGCQKLTLPFSYFSSLLSTLKGNKYKQPEPISQLRAL